MSDWILTATDLHKNYSLGRTIVQVLRGSSLNVERGEFLAVTGSSGSGKSTLLHLLGALDRPDRGTVSYEGKELFRLRRSALRRYCNREVGFVFQFYHLLPELTAFENVLITTMISHSGSSWLGSRRQAHAAVEEIIDRVGLSNRKAHRPKELSGGERQRIAIARALVNRPALLLADEPTGNLDASIGGEILDLLGDLNDEGQTIVMVTHDRNVADRAHRRAHLAEGVIRVNPVSNAKSLSPRTEKKEVFP